MLRVRLLGGLTVEIDGREVEVPGSWRARPLLGWLALHPGSHRRSEVAARFWPDILDTSARASLRTSLWALRRVLGPSADALIATRERVGLSAGASVWIDTSAFSELLGADRLEEALTLCRGELLAGLDDDWVYEARDEHRDRTVETLGRLAERAEAAGDLRRALGWTRRQVELDPLAEGAHHELIRRLAAAGDRVHAIACYERLRERLQSELGLAPSPATQQLVQTLRTEVCGQQRANAARGGTSRPSRRHATPGRLPIQGSSWEPGAPFPAPPRLLSQAHGPFVGREAELERLRRVWAETCEAGELGFVLLAGEAGIGKTRLAAELARTVGSQGAIVLHGYAEEDAVLAHQPFVEAIRHYVAVASPAELRGRVEPHGGELERILPELATRLPELGETAARASDPPRYLMFEAVTSLLVTLSSEAPVLLVLDDLHWADRSTAALLGHLLCSRRKARVLVVGAYRESELVPAGPLADALAGLLREQPIERLRLCGLDETQVVELARGRGSDAELAASIHAETEGNPFFVKEMLRHVAESGTRRLGLPESVKDVIGQRLDRLSVECVQVLTLSSVIGQDFDVQTLERISKLDGDGLIAALEEAVRAGILAEVPHAFERFSFSHALIRQTLAARLTRTRRGRIHARVGEALEELHAARLDPVLPQIAHHYCEAGRAGEADKAVEFAVRAGEQASYKLAHAEAVDFYTRALAALSDHDGRRRRIMLRRAVAYMALTHTILDAPGRVAAGRI